MVENKIRQSAEKLDIPDALTPDAMQKKLEQQNFKKRPLVFRYAAVAAVFAVLLLAGWGITEAWLRPHLDGTSGGQAKKEETVFGEKDILVASNANYASDYSEIYNRMAVVRDILKERLLEDGATAEAVPETPAADAAVEEEAAADIGVSGSETSKAMGTTDYSETNVQTEGVDEGDVIKTDGEYVYVMKTNGTVHLIHADGGSMEETAVIRPDDKDLLVTAQEFYVAGDRLVLICHAMSSAVDMDGIVQETDALVDVAGPSYSNDTVVVFTYDISNKSKPKEIGRVEQKGTYFSSRRTGDYLYLFTNWWAEVDADQDEPARYVPSAQNGVMNAKDIYLPEYGNDSMYLIIASIDLRRPDKVVDQKAILAGYGQTYVSTESVYIYEEQYTGNTPRTEILKFHYEDGKFTAIGGRLIKGMILDTFAINEFNGYLRVVSTIYGSITTNALYVLDDEMKLIGRIEDLAPDEQVYSARFMGNTAYFVTYRNMDPLFSVDLTDPENPRILGELKITGFSEYLHPYSDTMLMGLGLESDPDTGDIKGLKLSMFDVTVKGKVTEKDKLVLSKYDYASALYDYKSMMIDTKKNLFGFVAEGYSVSEQDGEIYREDDMPEYDYEYLVFTYDQQEGFKQLGKFKVDSGELRALYIGDYLYVINRYDGVIASYDLENLKEKQELEF